MGSADGGFDKDRIPKKAGDPTRREFTYFMLGGARFIYASSARLALIKVSGILMTNLQYQNSTTCNVIDISAKALLCYRARTPSSSCEMHDMRRFFFLTVKSLKWI